MNKGAVSNLSSLALLVLGAVLTAVQRGSLVLTEVVLPPGVLEAGPWVLAVGIFGFAGGVTNWLAVKMLFDRVPFLYGSGVIPNRFEEIRVTMKNLIMAHFFDEAHLRRFYEEHAGLLTAGEGLEDGLVELLESDDAGHAIERQLEELKNAPFGMLIRMAGTDILRTVVQEFLKGLASDLGPQLKQQIQGRLPDVTTLRDRVDLLLESKLEELTPETVKRMMEHVIREHLGWLIVWGNVFGGVIGLISKAVSAYLGVRGMP